MNKRNVRIICVRKAHIVKLGFETQSIRKGFLNKPKHRKKALE